MRIEKKKISDLKRAAYNPRVQLQPGDEDYESIRYSLETFGLVQPIVWNQRTGNVVSGHQRLSVLEAQGAQEVDVSVVDLDDISEKQLNVALNKVEGNWDENKLSNLLNELGADATLTGFTPEEIEIRQKEVDSFFDDLAIAQDEEQQRLQQENFFDLTLTFDEADKKDLSAYIKENGTEPIVRTIIRKAKGVI